MNVSAVIDRFSRSRILAIGEAMLDRYLHGTTTHFSQETPVPVVTISQCINQPGGAANTAVNLQSLSAETVLLSVIGNDWEGAQLKQALSEYRVTTAGIIAAPNRTTLTKQRVIDDDRVVLRFDHGSTDAIAPELENQLVAHLQSNWNRYDAVVISDYGYGILTDQIIDTIAQYQAQCPKTLTIDAKNLNRYQHLNPTAVKPNYGQTLHLLNQPQENSISRIDYIQANANQILEATGAQIAAVTLDQDGAIILQRDRTPYRLFADPACPTQTIGAGDTFTAAFTIALSVGAESLIAADIAAAAAAIVVRRSGTAHCTIDELKASVSPS